MSHDKKHQGCDYNAESYPTANLKQEEVILLVLVPELILYSSKYSIAYDR